MALFWYQFLTFKLLAFLDFSAKYSSVHNVKIMSYVIVVTHKKGLDADANNKGSDQPVHLQSPITAFAICTNHIWTLPYLEPQASFNYI